jgi:hypothetical protein
LLILLKAIKENQHIFDFLQCHQGSTFKVKDQEQMVIALFLAESRAHE